MHIKFLLFSILFFNVCFLQLSPTFASMSREIEIISSDKLPQRIPSHFTVNTSHTQEELEALNKCGDIKSLDLRAISSNLAPLALFRSPFSSVEELYIGRISFIEQILEELPSCMPSLSTLVLECPIESSVLHHLHALNSLKILKSYNMQLAKAEHVETLLDSNPNLMIYLRTRNSSSEGGLNILRKNPRIEFES